MKTFPIAFISALTLAPQSTVWAQARPEAELPAIKVSGSTVAQQTRKEAEAEQAVNPGGVTIVDSADLRQRETTNIADMLRYVPGVWSTSASGTDGAFISIRGSNLDSVDYDMNGVKLLQDGLPVTAADGNNHNRFIDPLSARFAVVARGANALTYGASTLGGAIDFTSPTALDSAPLELFLNTGSFGLWQGRVTAGLVRDKVDALVSVEGKKREGYREHNEQERKSLYGNLGWQVSDTLRNRFYFSYIDNKEELPGPLTYDQWKADPDQAEAAAVRGHYQWNVETWRAANKTTWDIDANSSLSVGFSYEEQQLYHPIVQSTFFSLLIDTEQRNFGTAVRYNLRAGQHDLLVGLDYGKTAVEGGNYGNNAGQRTNLTTLVDNSADSTTLFFMDRWRFAPQWTAVYGLQGVAASREIRNTNVATGALRNPKADYDSINPRIGAIYHLSPQSELFANASRVYEAPTTYQLEDNVAGNNQTLDAMYGNSFEVGTRGRTAAGNAQLYWDLALYYARLRNEILSVDDPAAPGTSLTTNVDKTTHAGVEAMVGGSFPVDAARAHRIEPLLSMSFNRFHFDNDPVYGDKRLPAAPTYAVRGEMIYRHASGFFFGPTFDVVGDRYADFSNTYKVDSYTLWGLRGGLARKTWEVFAEVRNITDEDYISRFSVRNTAAPNAAILSPGEPLSAYVGVTMRF